MREPGTSGNGDAPAEPTAEAVKKGRGNRWHGCFKLSEELGEIVQLLGKLGPFPVGPHPDGKGDLTGRLQDELGDALAAISYFIGANPQLNMIAINQRMERKHALYCEWGLDGLVVPTHYNYIGDDVLLLGVTALARFEGNSMFVQVDRLSHPWAHGWHLVDPRDWEVDEL